MPNFAGKTAVVTGGAAGIGADIVRRLRRDGASVAIVDWAEADLEAFRREPGEGELWSFRCDLTQADQTDDTVAAILAACGSVSILVNNAGGSGPDRAHTLEVTTDAIWSRVLELNLTAVFRMCRALAPQMRAARNGRIVNLSSLARRGLPRAGYTVGGVYPYVVAKAGIAALTRQLALDLGPDGITVNAIAPGVIHPGPDARVTKDFMAAPIEFQESVLASIPVRRAGDGNDIAATTAFLVSDEGAYITGQTIDVDGGL